jgi:uncharacterized repeat protein (TIGR01451 family)/gliding motility-associated-like protein
MNSGAASATLNLGSSPSMSVTGTNTMTFSGGTQTVNYNGAATTIIATTYNNLTISGTLAKTFPSGTTTVNGILSVGGTATATITGTLSYGSSATLQYNGTGAQTTGNEFPTTWTGTGGVIIANTSGSAVTLGNTKTINALLTVNSGANLNLGTGLAHTSNSLVLGGAGQAAGTYSYSGLGGSTYFANATGTLAVASTLNTWTGATSTDWHVGTNWSSGLVPTSTTSVTIPSGGNQPIIGAAAGCSNVNILTGASLTISGSNTLTVSGNWTNSGTFTKNTSTVNFNGTAQNVGTGPFNNLTLSTSGVKTLTGVTVNGILSMEGTATVSGTPTYGTSATLQYNTATARTAGSEWLSTFAATGGVTIANTGTITLNGNKVFNASVPLTINGGATLNTDASNNRSLTFGGNFIKNGTLTANSSSITIASTMASQSIAGFTTTGTVSMTKTGGTATFTGNVSGGGLTINGSGGTLHLGTGLTHTFTGTWTRTNGTLNGGSSLLKIGSGVSGTGGTFTAGTGTVEWNKSNTQTCAVVTYNNLTLSGTSAKTFATTPTVNGILSIEGTATITVTSGVVTYGTNATLQYKTTDTRTATSEEWISPFTGSGGVIIANTLGSVTMDAAKIFNTSVPLTINSGATLITNNFQLTLGGNFVKTGTFTAGSSPIVITGTMAAQSIGAFSTTGAVSMTKTSGTATFTGVVGGASLTLNGAGTLKLSAANTYSGVTTLNAGTLVFAASNSLTASSVVLNGGTMKSGISTGYGATTGATLNVTSNSTLALGTGIHSLTFATGSPSWSNYATLTISGWTGSFDGTTGTAGKIFAGTTNAGLSTQQLSQIQFKNGSSYYPATILSTGEVVPTATAKTFCNLSYPSPNTYISTSAITPLSPTITGTPTGYSVSPALPAGLSIDASTGVISGSPTITTATNTYVVTATNGSNTTLFGIVISVHIPTTYYAKATGDWNVPGTWSLVSGASSATTSTTVPVAGDIVYIGDALANGARTVTVPSGYNAGAATVNLGSSVGFANNLTLADLTSSLAVSGDITITRSGTSSITNSLNVNAGAVTVNGSITMSGTNTTTSRITQIVTTTGTLTIAGNLTLPSSVAANNVINMSGGAGTLNLGGVFTPGLGTLSAGTASTFNFNGSIAQDIPIGVSSINYYNITVNNTSGSGATLITNAITSSRVTGDLSVQSGMLNNGGLAISLATDKNFSVSNGSTFNLSGTSSMPAVSGAGVKTFGATSTTNYLGTGQTVANETYGHLILSTSGAKAISSGATTQGDFTISGTASATAGGALTIAGNITLGNGTSFTAGSFTHNLSGNWTNNGATFTNTGSTISFANTAADQTILGSATTTFNNLTVNKDPGKLIISTAAKVAGTLTMTSGNIQATALLELGTSTSATGALSWTAGNIIGGFKRWIATTASDIQFPVGTTTNNNMAVANFTNLTNGSLTVSFTASNPGSSGLPLTDGSDVVDREFSEGYWTLAAANSLASTDYSLILTGNGFTSYTEDNTVRILRRVDNSSAWTLAGSNEVGTPPAPKRSGLDVFGDFAHGRVNPCSVTASSVTKTDVTCFGGSNGTITVSGLSGATNYQFSKDGSDWTNTTGSFTGLAANTYLVEMRDASNTSCIVTLGDQVLSQPTVLNAVVSKTNVACNGASTGTISVSSPSGGDGTYEYRLGSGTWRSSGNFAGLAANTYSVQIQDAVNAECVVVLGNQTITQPSTLTLSTTPVNPTCSSNGSITPEVSGDTSPYTYDWTGLTGIAGTNNAAIRTGLVAGTYNLTVTDANGCTISSGDIVIAAATGCTGIDVCKSNTAKVFSVTPDPDVTSYSWTLPTGAAFVGSTNTASIVVNFTGVAIGTHTVKVKTVNICNESDETLLTVYVNAPTATASVIGGACDGSNLQLSAGGGQTYSWSGPNNFTSSSANPIVYNAASGTNEGDYIATATDQKGCSAEATVNVILNAPPAATEIVTDASCGTKTGAIDIAPTEGDPFTFMWSNGAVTEDLSLIAAGNYSVKVTNSSGCSINKNFVVSNTGGPSADVASTNVTCNGGTNGTITLTVTGGTSPYTYLWSNGATTKDLTGLAAGTFDVVITDATGCTGAATATITQPNAIQIDNSITNINCKNASTGAVNIIVTGGTGSFTYEWSGTSYTASSQNISSRPAGTYNLTVHDGTCSATGSYIITQPSDPLAASTTVTPVTCNGGANGIVNLTVTGGTSPYTFAWTRTESGYAGATTEDLSGLAPSTYNVTVTDAKGCTTTTSGTVTQPAAISLSTSISNVSCKNGSNGAVNLTVSGGTQGTDPDPAYTFVWSNSSTSEDLTGLLAGTYGVTVTDANGCTKTGSYAVTEPTLLAFTSATVSTPINCNGETGTVTIVATGGTTPRSYTFNGVTNETGIFSGVHAGAGQAYSITDAGNCGPLAGIVDVTQPSTIAVSGAVTNVKCNGSATGEIDLTPSGGTPGASPNFYTYAWTASSGGVIPTGHTNDKNLTGLVAGTYTVTVSDFNECNSTATSFTITQPSAAITPSMVNTNVTCKGSNNGSINLSVTGGVTPYTYVWKNAGNTTIATTEDISGLAPGIYTVTVTDANLCTATLASNAITEPADALSAETTPTAVICKNGTTGAISVVPSGGTGEPYTYSWSTGATTSTITGLVAGTYNVTVTDENGCTFTPSASVVTEPATQIELFATTVSSSSCGTTSGSIDLSVVNGSGTLGYAWTNSSQTIQDPVNLGANTYTATVTDALGCHEHLVVVVGTATAMSVDITTYPKTCISTDGSAYAIVSGGVAPYTYLWSNGATTQDITNVDAATYSVTITDANGCTATNSGTVSSISCLPPETVSDVLNTNYNTVLNGTVSPNDSDPDGTFSDLEFFNITYPSDAQGTLEWASASDGTFRFTPTVGYAGTFTLNYKVFDLTGLSTPGTFSITVGPNAVDDPIGTSLNTPVSGDVKTNDVYETGSSFTQASDPTKGNVTFNANGTFTYTPNTGATGDDSFTYTVCLPTPNTGICSSATVLISINGQADVEIAKSVDNATPNVGSNVVFTLTATNHGPNLAMGVGVSDALPNGYTYVSNDGGSAVAELTGTVSWTIGSMANLATATLHVTAKVNATGTYNNTATISGANTDPTPGNNTVSRSTTPVPQSDVTITKAVNHPSADVGSTVIFTLTATNNGPSAATGVSVTDQLPSGFTYVSDNGAGAYVSGSGVWTVGTLANGASATLTISASVNASGTYNNAASISSTTGDPTPGNNSASAAVAPGAVSDLSITKTVNNSTPYVGSIVEFTLTATNNGPSTATNVKVADVLPSGYTYTSDDGSGKYVSGTGIWTIGTLANAATSILKISAKVLASGTYANTATIGTAYTPDQPDNTSGNNTSTVTPVPVAQADLSVVKTVDNATPTMGENVVFTLTVTNNGLSSATSASVTDLLPSGYTYVSYTASVGSYVSGTGVWTIGTLANAVTATLAITAAVKSSGDYLNTATISATTADLTTSNNTSSRTINPNPIVTITNPAAVCSPSTVNLTASGITTGSTAGLTYTYWTNSGATTPYASPLAATAGTYYIKGTTTAGGATIQPVTVTVNTPVGGTASGDHSILSGASPSDITLSGYTGTIQWQYSDNNSSFSDISGATAATLTSAQMGTLTAARYYRAVLTSGSCTTNSNTVTVTINSCASPTISVEPASTAVCSGAGIATFSVTASGASTYQWEEKISSSWVAITNEGVYSGATTNTLTITNPTVGMNGYKYRCVVAGSCLPNTTSNGLATLTSNALPSPSFTAQAGTTACTGSEVTYTTQSGQTGYVWNVPGTLNTDYSIISGGTGSTSNTVTLKWLTTGSKTVTINYTNPNGCTAASATSSTATTVSFCNAAPVVSDFAKSGAEDNNISFIANNFTSKFTDSDGNTLVKVKIVTLPANGTLKLSSTVLAAGDEITLANLGNLVFVPDLNWNGSTSFNWNGNDGTIYAVANATVSITISPVNDPPVANNDTKTTLEDTPTTINVTTNDTDVDGTVDVATVDLNPAISGIQNSYTDSHGNVWTVSSSGVVTFTPSLNFNGEAMIHYTVKDNLAAVSNIASITVTVTPVNDPPVALNDNAGAAFNTPVTTDVLANDYDEDGNLSPTSVTIVTAPLHGATSVNAITGAVTYTPNTGYYGPDSYVYRVCDTDNACVQATVNIEVPPISPVAVNDAATTDEQTAVVINVVANDYDPQGDFDYSSVRVVTTPGHGTISINPTTGAITYTPSHDYSGSDQLTYEVCDLTHFCSQALVNITVTPLKDIPVAIDDIASVDEDGVLIGTSVLYNDFDPDFSPLIVSTTPVSGPSHGSLELRSDGTYTYTPVANFNGTDSFVYQVCDDEIPPICASATVTITVNAVNDPPVAVNNVASISEGAVLIGANLLANDSDPEGNTLTINTTPVFGPGHGTLVIHTNGTYTFTPAANYYGTDSFTYQVCDNGVPSQCSTAVVTITITEVNNPPVAVNDTKTTSEDTSATIAVTSNDTDVDGSVDVTTVDLDPSITGIQTSYSDSDGNVWTVNSSGVVTIVPSLNFNGEAVIHYTVKDNLGAISNIATITVTVSPVNDTPVAVDDNAGAAFNMPVTTNVLSNDSDVDGNLNPASVTVVTAPAHGTTSVNAVTGTVTYTPNTGYYGADSYVYRVCDTENVCVQATVHVQVPPIAPVAVNDAATTEDGSAVTVNVVANDYDPQGDFDYSSVRVVSAPGHGSTSVNPTTGAITYTPAHDYDGTDQFTYEVCDLTHFCSQALVTITVTPVEDVPVAIDDVASIDEDGILSGTSLLFNDFDPDSSPLTISTTPVTGPSHGTLVIRTDGTYTYTPDANFHGSDSFVYRVCDDAIPPICATATVTITVNSVNDPPVAVNDVKTTNEDTPVTINVTGNDTDVDGTIDVTTVDIDPSTAGIQRTKTMAGEGTYVVDAFGIVTFTPVLNFNGTATSISYTVKDNSGALSNIATLSITVTAVNDAPVTSSISVTTNEDTSVSGTLTATDVEGNVLTFTKSTNPSHGTVVVNANGTFTYTPDPNYNGTDSFTYQVCDNGVPSLCATATVTITVTAVNDPPVASALPVTTLEDTSVSGVVSATDADGDVLTFGKSTNPAHGTVVVNANGTFTYTPSLNYNGPDSFVVVVSDGKGGTTSVTVYVTVIPVNDPPVALAQPVTSPEDTPVNGVVTATDPDGDPLTFSKATDPLHGKVTVSSSGTYIYTPDADYFGPDSFTVSVSDGNGGVVTVTVNVAVIPVNDAPSFRNSGSQTACGNGTLQPISNWATSISAGPVNESGQKVQFTVTNSNNALFSIQPAIDASGTLTYIPESGKSGTATVSVLLTDDGGTLNGGINVSAVQTFIITVNALPAAPALNTTQEFCARATVADLMATAPVGSTLSWFAASTGGTALAPTYALSDGTLYYAESSSTATGCKSSARAFTVVIIHGLPSAPTGPASQTFCKENNPKISDLTLAGLNLKWFAAATGGAEIARSTLLVGGTTYYASQTTYSCESASRTAVSVALTSCNSASNHPPVVSDISKTITQNQPLTLSQSDFTGRFTDPDNDQLFKIRIESLPLHGRLELSGMAVTSGQEIPATDLGRLAFIPDKDYAGETWFRWSGSDGKVYSATPASVNITIYSLTVFIPQGFSPNGDGINDHFVIKGAERFVVTLRVFNRWGNKVFESEHYKNDWDGVSNVGMLISNQLPGGTYYYTVNFNNGEKEIIGYLTLNR